MSTNPTNITTQPLTNEHKQQLSTWRASALDTMPYFASLIFSLRPVNAPGLGTLAVDRYHRLYIDFDATDKWDTHTCGQILLHEACHVLYEHWKIGDETGETNPQLLNIANDLSINDDLVDAGCHELAESGALLPFHFGYPSHETPHEYVARLQQDAPNPPSTQNGCGDAAGSPGGYELSPTDDLNGTAPAITPEERTITAIAVATDIREHHEQRGKVPAGIRAYSDQVFTPTPTPWQKILHSLIRQCRDTVRGNTDRSYTQLNRRNPNPHLLHKNGTKGPKVVWPGEISPDPHIVFIRDQSGSMGDNDLTDINSEIVTIATRGGVNNLRIVDADINVHAVNTYSQETLKTRVAFGGTDMSQPIAYVTSPEYTRTHGRPDLIIVGTDGYTPWGERPPVPTIIVCTTDAFTPDWATTIRVKP